MLFLHGVHSIGMDEHTILGLEMTLVRSPAKQTEILYTTLKNIYTFNLHRQEVMDFCFQQMP